MIKLLHFKRIFFNRYGYLLLIILITQNVFSQVPDTKLTNDLLEKTISFNINNATIVEALDQLSRQTGIHFTYQVASEKVNQQFSIKAQNEKVGAILRRILNPYQLDFSVIDGVAVIQELKEQTEKKAATINSVVSGRVIDAQTKEPLPGAVIKIDGVTNQTQTDRDGKFQLITGQSLPYNLTVSFIGYKTVKAVAQTSPIEIALAPDQLELDAVVVMGYGSQKKKDVTGAVGTVKFDNDINSRPAAEFGQALYGKIAGVQVINNSGQPGASSTVKIRGTNSVSASSSALIVIDGIPVPNYDLNQINTQDIESIDILKDAASSAIYGSRAANGVILVTTKKGKEGAPKLQVSYSSTLQEVVDKVAVMNSAEYAQASIDAAQNGWIQSGGDPSAPNTLAVRKQYKYMWPETFNNPSALINTDWQDLIYRKAPLNKIDLSVSGGNNKSTYAISGGFIKQKGIVINSEYQKISFSTRASAQLTDWAEIGGMISITNDHNKTPFNRIFEWAAQYPSIYPVYGNNGYLGAPNTTDGYSNWDAILFRPTNGHPLYRITDDIQAKRFNGLGNAYVQFKPLKGLSFKSALNFYYNRTDNSNYQAVDHNLGASYNTIGIMTSDVDRSTNYTWQNLLNYKRKFGEDHNLNALLGFEYNENNYYQVIAERTGYDNDELHALKAGKTVSRAEDVITKTALISYFGRLNYDYKSKYLLSASLRRDGSSRFGPNNKWGYFPAVSAGWVISNESFFENINNINNLKLRASYGLTGNDRFADYRWISTVAQGRGAIGNSLLTTYYPGTLANEELKWERTKQLNIGLEMSVLQGRIGLEADYYLSKSDGLLLDVPIPSITGFNTLFQNIGKLQNQGIELKLNTRNLTGNFEWSSEITFSANRNKVLALGPDNAPIINGNQIIEVGKPLNNLYGYRYLGVYKNQAEVNADPARYAGAEPGDGKYEDINGDGKLNAADRTILGNGNPDFIYGFTNNFKYKNFDLSLLVIGTEGSEFFDGNALRSMLYHEGRNYSSNMVNRWRSEAEPGDGYHYKLNVDLDGFEKNASNYWIYNGSYIKLKNVTLGYTFSKELLRKIHLNNLRVFINGNNLYSIHNSLVIDPENGTTGSNSNPFPSARTYTLGINIGL